MDRSCMRSGSLAEKRLFTLLYDALEISLLASMRQNWSKHKKDRDITEKSTAVN